MGHFSSKMSKESLLQSMAIVIGPCLFTKIEDEDIGNIWFQQDGATGYTAEARLDVLRAVFLCDVVKLLAAELISFGHLGAAI